MKVPTKSGPLILMGRTIASAMILPEAVAYVPADGAAAMNAATTALEDAVEDHGQICMELTSLRATRNVAQKEADRFISNAVQALKPYLGLKWNGAWQGIGFLSGSIAIPEKQDARFGILVQLGAYLTAHPEHQALNAQVTGERAGTLANNLVAARGAVNNGVGQRKAKAAAVKAAGGVLQKHIRNFYTTLLLVLAQDNQLWNSFGFPRPIDQRLPLAPTTLTIQQTGPGVVLASWNRGTRASRYRLFIQVPGEDNARVTDSVQGLLTEVSGLPAAVVLTFTVVSGNSVGESSPGAPVEFTLH